MGYYYYVQEYAKNRAESILPVPIRGDFDQSFISDFSTLTKILKKICEDVIENSAAYGCDLYPLDQERREKDVGNETNINLDRIVKCLRTHCDCGKIKNNF
jgi:hypothetical protein